MLIQKNEGFCRDYVLALCFTHIQCKKFDAAIILLNATKLIYPENPATYKMLCIALIGSNNPQAAREALEELKAIQNFDLEPWPEVLLLRALIAGEFGEYEAARELLHRYQLTYRKTTKDDELAAENPETSVFTSTGTFLGQQTHVPK